MNAGELYRDGKLSEAIDAVQQEIKRDPVDTGKRVFLSQLLLFTGDWERADKQLEVVTTQSGKQAVGIALLRQLVRGEIAREQLFAEGRPPSLLADEDVLIRLHLEAAVLLREGKLAEASSLLGKSEDLAGSIAGTCNGKPFSGLRDLDDVLAPVLEVITPNGKYYWINLSTVASLEFHPPEQVFDVIWRRATASIEHGPQGDIYIPTRYPGSHTHEDELVRLCRKTDWTTSEPVRGIGQREFLVGEEAIPIMEIEQLNVTPAA